MRLLLKFPVMVSVFFYACAAFASEPLVDVGWVKANLQDEKVVIVDLRSKSAYLEGHIPGAVHSQYGGPNDQWRTKSGEVRGVVNDPAAIADHLGSIGISNDSHVVLVPAGISSAEVATATRVYWTLNYLGHEEVSILNGGMSAYLKDLDKDGNPTNPMQEGMVELVPTSFIATPKPEMIATAEAVEALMSDGAVPVDNRPHDFYLGVNKSGSAKAAGTIPGSKNLPHTWLTTDGKGSFRNADTLAKLYEAAGLSTAGKQVNFCNTGHLGSIGWFVSHELLGNEAAILFDGSMAEWTHSGREVEQKIRF